MTVCYSNALLHSAMEWHEPSLSSYVVALFALKTLCIYAYYSTDFEVHRNWLAVTYSLPFKHWYYENTSQWTLDYPPGFAWFEYLLSQFARQIDPKMVEISAEPYTSLATVLFQRFTVIITDFVYVLACFIWYKVYNNRLLSKSLFLLLVLNVVSFIYPFDDVNSSIKVAFNRTLKLFAVVLGISSVSLGPFVYAGQMKQLITRLFPFGRGLTHAYWAPNFWALYNFCDFTLYNLLRRLNFLPFDKKISYTSGLVQEVIHVMLPQISPLISFLAVILNMLPFCISLLYRRNFNMFLKLIVGCAFSSFLFGWHVHEKAVLTVIIPLTMLAVRDGRYAKLSVNGVINIEERFIPYKSEFEYVPCLHLQMCLHDYYLYFLRSGPPSRATELKDPSFRYPQQPSSSPPHWVGATQCNGPACNCYGVVGGYRPRILFDSGSTISLIRKNLLSLTNCDKNISACDVVLLTASGEEVNPRNSVTLPLQLGSFDGRHHFVVMDSLLTDIILGTDFMTKYGICIDLGGRKIFGPSLGEIHILADSPAQSCRVGNESDNENSDHDDEARICAIPNSRRQSQHLDLPSCPETYQNIVSFFKNIFRTTPGLTSVIEHRIWTVGSPVRVPPRLIPEDLPDVIEKQLQEMLKQGIIQPSNSPWMAPAVYTPKKSGEVRICVDYRKLNKKTRKDAYPLPLPDDIFDKVRGAAVFSTLDIQSGFWQIPVNVNDKEKTALLPGPGMSLFQFTRMLFGLTGALSTFQRAMDSLLKDLPFAFLVVMVSPSISCNAESVRQERR
ncbi:Dolichyl pyrophosphate Glc1Man9GlcNAc2 alpha-1,3-glucosyltransferase [Trichinella nativa]|uniref:Alpha-1,3-glucosyltransferase n=1 Tax=Trichinella nativa TaxID=6335 RepID=A0A0V1KRN1_9BILA|nr:Dolichyl pyrophosphate Glc1Man9GlcNAc2 alpha-1,3-glucosyltransferase [Trichinella nativa]